MLPLNDLKVSITHHATPNKKVFPSIPQKNTTETFTTSLNEPVTPKIDQTSNAPQSQLDSEQSPEASNAIQLEGETLETAQEVTNPVATQIQAPRIKIIGPWHPTLITSNLNDLNILPYKRQPAALLTTSDKTPQTYRGALKSVSHLLWQEAIDKELENMHFLKVWEVVDLHEDYKLVGTTWVFKIKRNERNKPIEHKSWLCAQGFMQSMGIDFSKTYAPTGRLNSLRKLVAFACVNKLQFHQIDIKSAFLNAQLKETVYLAVPQGLQLDKQNFCLRLNKAIYRLRQAPLAWYEQLTNWLESVKFSVCTLDPCVFYRAGSTPVWLYIHVDDIGIFSKNTAFFKAEIEK
ncbi:hypothetical protein O181_042492 [Austropuccinia psidii MF-1]|uniref:Reverse transcriptase Ty1/copia-type domain-containing protein n=1 Tax=Austropuccinia psidii MF-1 TaxID=1389203 RepID=A0A9Q3DIR1_9BASI|nr:hypothetical protein [Austropuccinia psidii MF-1]